MPLTSLVGRERELRQLAEMLDRDNLRVVTLLGPGGVGKTRLALEVARRLASEFADGAVFVPLESIRDAALLPGAVARACGLQDTTDRPAAELLAEFLAGRHLLLVLDNFEQVVAGACWVAELLADNPRLKAIVTSRTPLNIGGEQRMQVPPLALPEADGERTAAIDLFLDRAQALRHDFSPDTNELGAITEVCRRLDGLPLAIELAAARVHLLPPTALLARLTDRLTVLTGARQDVPVRLRSMRDAIAWSYDLLTVEEQRAFRRLAVFLGGFTLEALAFVVPWPDPPLADHDALALLQSLVDQSLAQPEPVGEETRYRMLETLREFGLQAAADEADLDVARRAHAAYFTDLARRAEPAMQTPDLALWLDRLEADYPNLLAALDWLEAHDRLEDAILSFCAVGYFLSVRGHVTDQIARTDRWLEHPALKDRGQARGQLLLQRGFDLSASGAPGRARPALADAVVLLHEAGDRWHEAQARTRLAGVYDEQGDLESTRRWVQSALETAREAGNHRLVSMNLNNLARFADGEGDAASASALREEALAVARSGGDPWAQAFHIGHLAERALREGDLDEAERLAEEQRHLLESYRSLRELPDAWHMLAWIARARGDMDAAAEHVATGLAIAERGGHRAKATSLTLTAGIVAMERDDLPGAAEALSAVLRQLDPAQQPPDVSLALDALACLAARAGDLSRAARFHGVAVRILRDAGMDYRLPIDVDDLHLRESLRERLGDVRIAHAEAHGALVPVEAVIAEAIAWAPPALAEVAVGDGALQSGLSRRELEVLRLLARGSSNDEIAAELFVSRRTVASHIGHILTKLDIGSRTAAVAYAIRNGLA